MRIFWLKFLASVLAFAAGSTALAATPVPPAPSIAASAYILIDFSSNQVIADKNSTQRLEPASLTKLMTSYAVLHELAAGAINLNDMVTISEKAWRTQGSRMFIEVGKSVSVQDLLKGMIIQSGNDASVALAEHVAGTESAFAALMNHHATRLGLGHSHFTNATGLPHADHYTTPGDMAKLARAIIMEFPQYYAWYSEREYQFNGIKQYNRNKLLWRDESVDGMKTGHTEAAGYCLVSSALRDDMRLIAVVMGSASENSRAQESLALLNYGFRFFETHRLYGAGETLTQAKVWKGSTDLVNLGLEKDLYVTIPRGRYKQLKAVTELQETVTAPISVNMEIGRVQVTLEEESIADLPLVSLMDVPEGGLLSRLVDEIKLMFQ